jgi:hypothetical protein
MDDEIQAEQPRWDKREALPSERRASYKKRRFKKPTMWSDELSVNDAFLVGLLLVFLSSPCILINVMFMVWAVIDLFGNSYSVSDSMHTDLALAVVIGLIVFFYAVPGLLTIRVFRKQPGTCKQILFWLTAFILAFNAGIFAISAGRPLP